ncbi:MULTISPECIES: helix-turn-helix domain-containing protein [unclassified Viridibacillus]|uniref:helix-turn-helix domain-containing protein n=1 Tax=unclassified Viridibacillus TaxID=2617942 RepID=UPI00096DB08F|nr:helix-turn-helix transcriptional regulator [Viridibacillus sp. FSL H8-0123]OMC83997.1 hypothetical protein BK130_05700 [Viridibacillus sp. FSL H8-0123]
MTFSERLRELRLKKDLTQREMAELLETTRQNYNSIENGKIETSHSATVKLAKFFNVSTDFLLCASDVPYPFALEEQFFLDNLLNKELRLWFVEELSQSTPQNIMKLKGIWDIVNDTSYGVHKRNEET